jgi:flagellar basal-body rod modification protein FlgD
MPIDSISTSALTAPGAFGQTGQTQGLGQEEFLKLLVAQMTNQDPLSPMDQEAMLAQLAQFSTVEGINNIKNTQTRMQASELLGKTVEAFVYRDSEPMLLSGTVTGVRWDNQGIFLSLKGSDEEISLDEISAIR